MEHAPMCAGLSCKGHFSDWTERSTECGRGTRNRTFTVDRPRQMGGGECEFDHGHVQREECNAHACPEPTDCKGRWGAFSRCSARCEGGTKKRRWQVIEREQHDGRCPLRGAEETMPCNDRPCAVNCRGGWGPWSNCSSECGGGTQSRTYAVIQPPSAGGDLCFHQDGETEVQMCNKHPCPVDCAGGFTPWMGKCDLPCGTPEETRLVRTFVVRSQARNGGKECEHEDGHVEHRQCEGIAACDVDCEGQMIHILPKSKCNKPWSACRAPNNDPVCSKQCGGGVALSRWLQTRQVSGHGKHCDFQDGASFANPCNVQPCPVNCKGKWEVPEDAACSKPCGGGSLSLRFGVQRRAENGGKPCVANEGDERSVACNEHRCEEGAGSSVE